MWTLKQHSCRAGGGNKLEAAGATAPKGARDATAANAAACGGRWRPRTYEYWGVEPRLDLRHALFGVANDAVIGFRYHDEAIARNQFRGADAQFQSLQYAQGFAGVNGSTGHRESIDIDVKARSYYAQNTIHVADWLLTPGIRVEDVTVSTDVLRADGQPQDNPESRLTNKQTMVLPGFGATWNGIAGTTIFAGIHKGFAPPRPDRDLSTGGAADTAVVDEKAARPGRPVRRSRNALAARTALA